MSILGFFGPSGGFRGWLAGAQHSLGHGGKWTQNSGALRSYFFFKILLLLSRLCPSPLLRGFPLSRAVASSL
jgi:hypothetical protein